MSGLDVLLIQPPNVVGTFFNLPGKEIPLSLCALGAYLRREKIECAVLDLNYLDRISPDLEKTLRERRPRLVGITSYTPNVAIAADIAARCKAELPEVKTVLGGFHASALPERTLCEFPAFDYLVAGEGEQTLTELVQHLDNGGAPENLPGLYARQGERIVHGPPREVIADLDSLPFADRGLTPVREYVPDPGNYYHLPSTGILFSRGCPYRCAFCSKAVFGHRIRYRSVENFLAEIEECIARWGICDFRLDDEAPTIDPRRMRQLGEEILRRKLAITWNCFSRLDSVDADLLGLMKAAGCHHITYGLESSLPQTQERIGKKFEPAQVEEIIRQTKRIGIECKVNVILGFPWETMHEMRSVVRFVKRISPDLVTFNLFKPLPGSALYDEMAADGRLQDNPWSDYFTTSKKLPYRAEFSEEEGFALLRQAVFSFYFRPRYFAQRLRRLAVDPKRELTMLARGGAILLRELWGALRSNFR